MTLADDIKRLRDDLADLHKQATVERSHFYVGSRCEDAIRTINQLVELVGNVYENLSHLPTNILDDVAEIAALAKGE